MTKSKKFKWTRLLAPDIVIPAVAAIIVVGMLILAKII